MRKRLFLLIAFVPLWVFAASGVLTLENALTLAMKNNASLKRESIALKASERSSRHSWNSLFLLATFWTIVEKNFPDLNTPQMVNLKMPS